MGEGRGRGKEEGRGFYTQTQQTHTHAGRQAGPDVVFAADGKEQEVPHHRLVLMAG